MGRDSALAEVEGQRSLVGIDLCTDLGLPVHVILANQVRLFIHRPSLMASLRKVRSDVVCPAVR